MFLKLKDGRYRLIPSKGFVPSSPPRRLQTLLTNKINELYERGIRKEDIPTMTDLIRFKDVSCSI